MAASNTQTTLEILLKIRSEAGDALKKVTGELQGLKSELQGLRAASGSGGLDKLVKDLTTGRAELQQMVANFRDLTNTLAGIVFFDKLKDVAQVAARTQVLGTVLFEIGRQSGYTRDQLAELDKQVQSVGITASASRQTLAQMLQAGLDVTKAAELARAAQNFAVIAGQDSSATLQRMIVNIQQLDQMGLRFIGINVDAAQSMAKFAQEVGKTPEALTKAEKQMALMNEVMRKGKEQGDLYVEAMGDVGKAVTSLSRLEENLAVTIGDLLLPAYKAIVDEYTIFLRQANAAGTVMATNGDLAKDLGEAVGTAARKIREFVLLLIEYKEATAALLSVFAAAAAVRAFALIFGFLSSQIGVVIGTIGKLGTAIAALGPVIQFITTALMGLGAASKVAFGGILVAAASIGWAIGSWLRSFEPVQKAADLVIAKLVLAYKKVTFASKEELAVATQMLKEAQDAWDGKGSEAKERLNRLLREQIDLQANLMDLENAYVQSRRTGTQAEQEAALKAFQAAKDRAKALDAEIKALVSSGSMAAEEAARRVAAAEAESKAKQIENAYKRLADEVNKAKEKLSIPLDLGTGNRAELISQEFAQVKDAFNKLVLGFEQSQQDFQKNVDQFYKELIKQGVAPTEAISQATKKATDTALVSVNQLRVGILRFAEAAKSPDEVAQAIDLIDNAAASANLKVEALKQTLQFRLEQASLKRVEDQLEGYAAASSKAKDALEIVRGILVDNEKAARDYAQTLVELGGAGSRSFEQIRAGSTAAANGIATEFSLFKSTLLETARTFAESIASQSQVLADQYNQNLTLLQDSERKKLEVIDQTLQGNKSYAASIKALDEKSVQERLALTKTWYDGVVKLRDQALEKFKEYANQLKALDEELYQNSVNWEKSLRDLKRQGLSEEEQYADKLLEMEELAAKQMEARQRKQFDLAKQLSSERIQLAQQLAAAQGVDKEQALAMATKLTNEAYEDRADLLNEIKKDTEAAARLQLTTYREQVALIGELTKQLERLATDQVTAIRLELPDSETRRVIQELQNAFNSNPIRVAVQAVRTGTGFATGGMVSGPGHDTSDNIPAWLSPGEWVARAKAVKYYGVSLFKALNDMAIPRSALKFAAGGLVPQSMTSSAVRFPSSGQSDEGQTKRDVVDLNINFNGRKVTLMGERNQVRGLVSALKSLEGAR